MSNIFIYKEYPLFKIFNLAQQFEESLSNDMKNNKTIKKMMADEDV